MIYNIIYSRLREVNERHSLWMKSTTRLVEGIFLLKEYLDKGLSYRNGYGKRLNLL